MLGLRSAVHATLNSPRLLAVAAAVALVERRSESRSPPSPRRHARRPRFGVRTVLELTGARPVFRATQGFAPDQITNVSAARIRTVVDRDRRTVDRIEVRFAATATVGETTDRIQLSVAHEFEVGIDVKRPAVLGSPQPGELVWQFLVY